MDRIDNHRCYSLSAHVEAERLTVSKVIKMFHHQYFVIGLLMLCFSPLTMSAQNASIPKPEDVIGFEVGSDFHLVNYEQSISYFEALDKASNMIEMKYAGKTTEGREWQYAVISSPENLAKLDYYKEISQKLAHPENLSEEEARELIKEGKSIVDINGGFTLLKLQDHKTCFLLLTKF